MKRVETYIGQQVYEWLFSAQAQNEMVGLGKLSAAMLGTSVLANGLACTQTTVASMAVQIGAGELYSLQSLEATACGTLPADTSHQILKQGIQLNPVTTAVFATPGTTGQSINYLIEAQYQDSDISIDPTTGTSPVVLQYWNATNPQVPWSGPNNSGATSNTFRDGIIAYQIKAGTAAATGSQVTPTPDAGWTGLWVVSVPFAATSLTSTNISQYAQAPILPSGLLQSLISSNLTYGIDAGTPNVIQATFPVPITALSDNIELWVKVKAANTGATTFTPNPGVISASPVVGGAHQALQGTELVANGRALLVWRADISSWVLVGCTGGALQVSPATQSGHATEFGQLTGVVGTIRNGRMSVPSTSATATFTADEIIVESALGGLQYRLANFSQAINLATTGAGGMDSGGAPASGFVALYAIYNPTTNTKNILATNAATLLGNVYGGVNMPPGYTASALIGVWQTSASSIFVPGYQIDRRVWSNSGAVLSVSSATGWVSLTLASSVPLNAKTVTGILTIIPSVAATPTFGVAGNSAGTLGVSNFEFYITAGAGISVPFPDVPLITPQTIFYEAASAGTWTFTMFLTSYTF